MDDEDALLARFFDDFIHPGGHFGDAFGGAFAPMLIPHVADDDGGLPGIPLHDLFFGTLSSVQRQRLGLKPRGQKHDEAERDEMERGFHGGHDGSN